MSVEVKISVNDGLYLKDPQNSKLGKNIIQHGILLIDELGYEAFTFKKLAEKINSTEASIYRYFKNKHLLLLYIVNWYWEWVNYLININTRNLDDPHKKLQIIIHCFVVASEENPSIEFVNESKLHNIVISEGGKAYHSKKVDRQNSQGFFTSYKELAKSVADIISQINPDFKYPLALASNLFEMSNNQIYFAEHIPKLTDISVKEGDVKEVEIMMNYFANQLLKGKV